ncbi:MAG: imidazole glycerol phosphate synthase subunit HisF [Geminicoccaceae bacterium]
MLAFRLIARMDIRNEHLIKTIRCEGVRKVGDSAIFAKRYNDAGIDELLYLDVVASLYGRNGLHDLLDQTTSEVFAPVTAAGGVRSVDDAHKLFDHGADKIALNTAAVGTPALIDELARKFGSQAVVLQLDAKQVDNGWEAFCEGGRQPTGRPVLAWAAEAVDRGCGELLLTSIDREGVRSGFDLALIDRLAGLATVPLIAAGGFGAPHHAVEAKKSGADGIAVAGALHYDRVSLGEIRGALRDAGVAVR